MGVFMVIQAVFQAKQGDSSQSFKWCIQKDTHFRLGLFITGTS
tara:strand:- start:438 stop:566 length:129 start_codon:yes stop_codon:yes gene_type:complete